MSATIMIRSSHFDGKNKFEYKFPTPIDLTGKEIALQGFSFYNTFFNISSALGNNKIQFKFPIYTTSSNAYTMVTFTCTVADGYYDYSDLNFALQQYFINAKLCLYNATSKTYTYFVQVIANTTNNTVNILTYYLPSAVQATALGYCYLLVHH